MIFSLCACNVIDAIRSAELPPMPTPEQPQSADPTPASDVPVSTAEPGEEPEVTAPSPDGGAELGERVIIYTKKTQENFDAPDGSTILEFSYVTPTVRIDDRPDAAEEINEQLRILDELYISGSGDDLGKSLLLENAIDNFSYVSAKGADINTQFSSARTAKSTRADGSVISFQYWTSVYTGGASGAHGYMCVNFDSQSGKKLTLESISADPAGVKDSLVDYLVAEARESGLYKAIAENELDPDSALAAVVREGSWLFTSEGIALFPPYGALSDSDGESYRFFTVPYDALSGVLDARFMPVLREGAGNVEAIRLADVENGTVQSMDRLVVSPAGEELYLKVNGTIFDVTVSNFFYLDQPESADRFVEGERHWYASYMTDSALQLCVSVPNGMPNLMISYTDADYVTHRFFLSEKGENGGIYLADESIQAVG